MNAGTHTTNIPAGQAAAPAQPANAQTDPHNTTVPFAWTVNTRQHPWLENCDYGMNLLTTIDGAVWLMHVPNSDVYYPLRRVGAEARSVVRRYKGPDLEHLQQQPYGLAADLFGASAFFCGMWWDETNRTLHALIHGEFDHNNGGGWCSKKTRLATSKDLGLTWTLAGDILTRALPNRTDYAGAFFEAGPADFDFYADVKGGYFYLTSWNSFTPKAGTLNGFAMYSEVARCAIADRMAPGKWFKFRDGTWTEPGLGGKACRVGFNLRGMYGGTIYSTYLKKYLRIGIHCGIKDKRGMPGRGFEDRSICISFCSDLAKQDWSPMARLLAEPANELFGFTLTDAKGIDSVTCGQSLRAYNYWQNSGNGRVLEISLKEGDTPTKYFPPHDSYEYESHPESGDRIESRKTKIVGAAAPEVKYDGAEWAVEKNEHYYEGQGRVATKAGHSIQFTFKGPDIYWRAVAARDGGKADVFIDDTLQETVDCFFPECPLPYQFAFIKTGLDPKRPHTIRIVVRGDKNAGSTGTTIRHIGFEFGG